MTNGFERAGNGAMRTTWLDLAPLIVGLAFCPTALAQSGSLLSGDYVCAYGCRLTDAPPSIAIDGDKATCTNEYGGLFHGRLLADDVLSCFNKTGRLSGDPSNAARGDSASLIAGRRLCARRRQDQSGLVTAQGGACVPLKAE